MTTATTPTAPRAPRRELRSAPELLDLVNAAFAPPARVTRVPNDIIARLNRRYRLEP